MTRTRASPVPVHAHDAQRAHGLGLLRETRFAQIIREYVRENPEAVALATGGQSKVVIQI